MKLIRDIRQSSQTYKIIVFTLLGNKCKRCNNNRNLHVHHKDMNWNNNKLNNLILLCKSCHGIVHGELSQIKFMKNNYKRSTLKSKKESIKPYFSKVAFNAGLHLDSHKVKK